MGKKHDATGSIVSVLSSKGLEMLIRQKNEQLNMLPNKVTTKPCLLEGIAT